MLYFEATKNEVFSMLDHSHYANAMSRAGFNAVYDYLETHGENIDMSDLPLVFARHEEKPLSHLLKWLPAAADRSDFKSDAEYTAALLVLLKELTTVLLVSPPKIGGEAWDAVVVYCYQELLVSLIVID